MTLKIKQPPLVRVKRSAQAFRNGPEILDFVLTHKRVLVAAADKGLAPVSAVSEGLRDQFPVDIATAPVRQFVGTAVKAVLADAGYEVHQTGVRLPRDPVFTTGTVYRKASTIKDRQSEAVREAFAAMVRGLSLSHKRILRDVIQAALGENS